MNKTKMNPIEEFQIERKKRIESYQVDSELQSIAKNWVAASMRKKYVYNFSWLGRPIIQYPEDIVALQEIIWKTRPDLIIETGIAHGGSLVLSASLLAMLDMCDAIESGNTHDPKVSKRKVIGLDIDIRDHNRQAIESHPMSSRIEMIQGSSIDPVVVEKVHQIAKGYSSILVCLDSNHTHDHVLAELKAYAPLVAKGSYCIVFDTFVENMPKDFFPDRPWNPGNSPKTAVWEFLSSRPEFKIDTSLNNKLLISVAPDGFLKRI
jgi:cephalosporin hydroxylase